VDNNKILLVCANPRGSDPLRTAEEDRTLRESIRLSPNRERFEIETINAATVDDFRRALLWKPFDVVHFSGHGTQTGLVFEDSNGRLMVPHSGALAELLARRGVKVALLNACYSLSVGKITAMGLEYTIASTGPISDPGAIEFARGFYDALGAGTDVPDAYAEGLSAAKLNGFQIDAILLKHGEEYVPTVSDHRPIAVSRSASDVSRTLLGVAIDTSGSMKDSIRNRNAETISRFESVRLALSEVGLQVRDELLRRNVAALDTFQVFIYTFGLRFGNGVADLASLWKATKGINFDREVEVRKRRLEEEGRKKATSYSDLASLARNLGYGRVVESVTQAAMNSARDQIAGEIANMVFAKADRLGDSTLTAEELGAMFETTPIQSDERVLEHVIFGDTPMARAASIIRERFGRTDLSLYDQYTLLLVSDGVPTDGNPRDSFTAIRDSGVNIIACFVTNDDIADPRSLLGAPASSWSDGARLMWDVASPLNESSPAAHYLLAHGWSIEPKAKLFIQVNHSDVLKEFVRIAASYFSTETTTLLPRGE
jgi:CHAT domain